MATSDRLRSKTLACLREGRVSVLLVRPDDRWCPELIVARVRSSRDAHPYRVELRGGAWSCTCRAGLRAEPCPHTAAVALVTTGKAA